MQSKNNTAIHLSLKLIKLEENQPFLSSLEQAIQQNQKPKKISFQQEQNLIRAIVEYDNMDQTKKAYHQLLNSKFDGFEKSQLEIVNPLKRTPFQELNNNQLNGASNLKELVHICKKQNIQQKTPFQIIKEQSLRRINSNMSEQKSLQRELSLSMNFSSCSFYQDQKAYKDSQFKLSMPESCVILISNLQYNFKTAQQIFNITSCFGNINKILLMKNLQKVMIEFKCIDGAKACAKNLHCLRLKNTELKVNYSKYQKIDLNRNNQNSKSKNFNEIYIPKETEQRYWNDNESHDKCSSFLEVQIKSRLLNVKKFQIWMERKSRACRVEYMYQKGNCVALKLTYQRFEDCIKALGYLHNKKFLDSKIKANFVNQY